MDARRRKLLAQIAKCGRCGSRLVPVKSKYKSIHYICPKMKNRACEGCHIGEEEFIKQLAALLKRKRIEITLEEKETGTKVAKEE
ncbi:MAG: zinc ribbon domain-containing protein [Minisyncoccia bacterium]|jgi:transposase